jgi:hypothetical protein
MLAYILGFVIYLAVTCLLIIWDLGHVKCGSSGDALINPYFGQKLASLEVAL